MRWGIRICRSENGVSLLLFFVHHLEVLVDDCHCQENPGATANGAKEICDNCKGTNTCPSEGCGCRYVAVQHFGYFTVSVALHHHLLVLQLLRHITCRGTRNIN